MYPMSSLDTTAAGGPSTPRPRLLCTPPRTERGRGPEEAQREKRAEEEQIKEQKLGAAGLGSLQGEQRRQASVHAVSDVSRGRGRGERDPRFRHEDVEMLPA